MVVRYAKNVFQNLYVYETVLFEAAYFATYITRDKLHNENILNKYVRISVRISKK